MPTPTFSPAELPDIYGSLPQRYPFLLIDRITQLVPDQYIEGIKNLSATEEYFGSYIPQAKIMPPCLIIEACMQLGAILLKYSEGGEGKVTLVSGFSNLEIHEQVHPGDILKIRVEISKRKRNFGRNIGYVWRNDQLIGQGEISYIMVDDVAT